MAAILSLPATGQTCNRNTGVSTKRITPVSERRCTARRSCWVGKTIPQCAVVAACKLRKVRVSAVSASSVRKIQPQLGSDDTAQGPERGVSYLFHTEIGGLVKVSVGVGSTKYVVEIDVSSMPQAFSEKDLVLSWGIFRSDSSWLCFPGSETSASEPNSINTPFIRNPSGAHTISLEFDTSQAPFYLSFLLYSSFAAAAATMDPAIRTHRKTNFCVPVGVGAGRSMPLGVSRSDNGTVNFSLFSRNAERVVLCLYDGKSDQPSIEFELDPYINRTGDIWHLSMESVGDYVRYGYRCKGTTRWDEGSRFHARRVLLDPYAKMIGNFFPDKDESISLVKCLGYLEKEPTFDWSGDVHPKLPMEKLVVYRLNVEHFTKDKSSGLPGNIAGTFAGVAEKVQHFIDLGVNAVLLEPIFSFDEKKGPYFPYHFFSPMNSYGQACDAISAINSMKRMVKTLHAHCIEVFLEVVFTHSSEGGDADCQTISFRGIDNSSYYVIDGNVGQRINNAVKSNTPVVQQMILDSLRYWFTEFRVDGFCFINSSFLLRAQNGDHLSRPPLVEAITFDPLLSNTKIIADCWSPVDNSYLDTKFPHWKRWAEMNTRFCRDVRNFLRGEGLLSSLATRLCGSGDIFSDSRGPSFSFNYITKNFGLPLVDLVSFSNAAELSWNCGEEGPTNKNAVLDIRIRQIRNFLFVLFVSLGVPVLNMGDECGFSTGGSSSYGDRQPINWIDIKTEFGMQITQFIAFLSSLRARRSDIFKRRDFLKIENIDWHGSNQSHAKWEDPSTKFLAMTLRAEKDDKASVSNKGDLFISFNCSDLPEAAVLPQLPEGNVWIHLVDTALPFPGFFSYDSDPIIRKSEALSAYEMKPHSCALFEAQKVNADLVVSSFY
ncbi:isoamylase 2, chloroplastic [Iris pallida]|uniref:Isoamylase 2, chloroplastic n=1 Tax=Iris pallida TaxID=29817 RepID=A0AAX6DQR8_IRIPA|nr:isoamylase 2, chloroplastic [Iris pallida]